MDAQTTVARAALEQRLAEAKQHRDHYNGLARETKAMAEERETPQGRFATTQAAMRYKAQALVWDREVCALTSQLADPSTLAPITFKADAVAGQDDTMNFVEALA